MMSQIVRHVALMLGLTALCSTAWAHHSVARFDRDNPISLEGTVKEFRWGNPHTWIVLLVPNNKGGIDEWEMEGGAVNSMIRQGWTRNTIQPGQKVKLVVSPLRDGSIGGEWMRVLTLNGQPLNVKPQQ